MAGENEDWTPKTRDDWVAMFADGSKKAAAELQSEREEAEAKKAADEKASGNDGGGKDQDRDAPKRKSFGERLLGL